MYSYQIPEDKKDMYAAARAEDVDASYKDLAQVCGRIRNKNANWAVSFLESAAEGAIPILYKRYSRHLGHRKELGGAKGRYPVKAAKAVLKTLKSAMANSSMKGLSEALVIVHAAANKKHTYPRLSPKGRRFRQDYSTSKIEIVLKEKVETPPEKRKERAEKIKKMKAPEPTQAVPSAPQQTSGAKQAVGSDLQAASSQKPPARSQQPEAASDKSSHAHENKEFDSEKKLEKKAERKPREEKSEGNL